MARKVGAVPTIFNANVQDEQAAIISEEEDGCEICEDCLKLRTKLLQTEQNIELLKKQKSEQAQTIKSLRKELAQEKKKIEMLQKTSLSSNTDVIFHKIYKDRNNQILRVC